MSDREQYTSQTDRPRIALEGRNLGEDSGKHTLVAIGTTEHGVEFYPHASGDGVLLDRASARKLRDFLDEVAA